MVQLGDYQYGYVWNNANGVDKTVVGIYKKDYLICSFSTEVGKEIARLMMSWHGLNARNELTDRELMEELKERGYTGKLTLRKEIEI